VHDRGNVLKDVAGLEGDMQAGYPTLAATRGINTAIKVDALFFLLFILATPFPYIVGAVSFAFLVPIALLDSILFYVVLSFFSKIRCS